MIPVVSVVGKSGSGKTTLLEKLISELTRRGRRVATIKHDAHSFDIDHEGKDTWRHFQAGAMATLISSPAKFAMVHRVEAELALEQLVEHVGDNADIVLTEGYRSAAGPKIEVVRAARSAEPVCTPEELIAVATDLDPGLDVPTFHIDDFRGLCDLIEERCLDDLGVATTRRDPRDA